MAFLVFAPRNRRRHDNSFDGNTNVGALVIKDALERAGIPVGFCAPETAGMHRLVLVSLTSTHDVFAFYRAVALRPEWQPGRRSFRVLAGGFGMQNPTTVRRYIDWAFFGRAHDVVAGVVAAILGGDEPVSPHIMRPEDPSPVTIRQAPLYAHEVEAQVVADGRFREQFTGCPLKCKFCHYTWARQHSGERGDEYVQSMFGGGASQELTWDGLVAGEDLRGRVRVAIDGFSERLRFLYGKPITSDDIVLGLERAGREAGTHTILAYNIANMPLEAEEDRAELYKTLAQVRPRHRVILVLHSTPFRPSSATPMQWEPAALLPDWSQLRARVICDQHNFRAIHALFLETPWAHLCAVIAERASAATDRLFHAICLAPRLRSMRATEAVRVVQREFDTTPFTKRYELGEPHPAWFLSGYVGDRVLRGAAAKMRRDQERALAEPGWLPPHASLVESRLRARGEFEQAVRSYRGYGTNDHYLRLSEKLAAKEETGENGTAV